MGKKTIIVLSCVWGRVNITRMFIDGLLKTQEKLKDVYNFINIVVDSDYSNFELFNNNPNFKYFNHQNLPVSNKWNYGLSQCKNFDFDYVLMMGSDDVISDDVLLKYNDFFESGYNYIGLTDLFVYNTIDGKFYYWEGYSKNSGRFGESLGLGRCLHKEIIEHFNHQLWDYGLNRGLDGSMEKRLKTLASVKKINFNSKDYGVSCDIKSDVNITQLDTFINQLTELDIHNEKYSYIKKIVGASIITVIIPTYDNVDYIDECITSILNSSKNINVEVLIGIDGCQKTLDHIKDQVFPINVKFFYFEKNIGPYIIKNTLSKLVKSKYILFFDSDDIMLPNMIPNVINTLNKFDCIKPMFFNKRGNKIINDGSRNWGEGVFGIKKDIFLIFNGFEPWRCAADSEFMNRIYRNRIKVKMGDEILFHRRLHDKNLTVKEGTNYHSKLRSKYNTLAAKKTNFGPLQILHIESFIQINVNNSGFDLMYEQKISNKEKLENIRVNINPIVHEIPLEEDIDYEAIQRENKKTTTSKVQHIIRQQPKPQENQNTVSGGLFNTNQKIFQKRKK